MHIFLSHNTRDKEYVRALAAQLRLAGADVWLDEWEIRPGDRIPVRVNAALAAVDTVAVIWSAHAAASRWVEAELASAVAAEIEDGSVRVVPVRLDETVLPSLLRSVAWIDGREGGAVTVARRILGLETDVQFIKAVQQGIEEAGLEFAYFQGYGVAVGCPKCGASLSELAGWSDVDRRRDDLYAGVRCLVCGWNEGGEI